MVSVEMKQPAGLDPHPIGIVGKSNNHRGIIAEAGDVA